MSTDTLRIYFDLCIIKYFLNIISPHDDMKAKINALLANYPAIDVAAIDFPFPLWLEERAVVAMKQLYKARGWETALPRPIWLKNTPK